MSQNGDRDEFLLRCLNAAANIYGVLTCDEFVGLYNGYAKAHDAPLDAPTSEAEVIDVIDRMHKLLDDDPMALVDEVWCGHWRDKKSGVRYIAYSDLLDDEDPDGRLRRVRKNWVVPDLCVLTEVQLLAYEDPQFGEECPEVSALADILEADSPDRDTAEIDAAAAQAQMRVNGGGIGEGLMYIAEFSDYSPVDEDEYKELVNALSKVESVTRTWNYRGHTQQELAKAGRLPSLAEERIPSFESLFGGACGEEDDDGCEGSAEDYIEALTGRDEQSEDPFAEAFDLSLDDLPPARYTGPIDFAFVKDSARREKIVADYRKVRALTQMFVRTFVMHEMTSEEREAAVRRLGFDKTPAKNDVYGWTESNRDIVAGDFGSMMDDQNGEPAIRRLLKQGSMDERTRKAADYYENYRYTWLEVLAVKAGVGLKCRDLLTGDELFLMECSLSQSPNVKGRTLCCGIGPIGEVYMALGVIQPADFENQAVILRIVLTHLGLPTELPVTLSFADQAKFAAETIRRLDANGKFADIHY